MNARSAKVRWSRRVAPHKIRRLYESDASGMLDQGLLDDVGYGIYVCCQESIVLAAAAQGNVECRTRIHRRAESMPASRGHGGRSTAYRRAAGGKSGILRARARERKGNVRRQDETPRVVWP